MNDSFIIYTDGSCDNIRYPNYGGWAYVILEDGEIIENKSGNDIHTTNNRMEMIAIINSISFLPNFSNVNIVTDSKYCIGAFSNRYAAKANKDLIEQFNNIVESKRLDVRFAWVRGHSGDKYNEMVDKMANNEFEKVSGYAITDFKKLKTDKEYRKEVFKDYKKDIKRNIIFNIVSNIVNDNHCKKGLDYIECKVNEIMKILKT